MNDYYTQRYGALPASRVGSKALNEEFQALERAFDEVGTDVSSSVAAAATATAAAETATQQAAAAAASANISMAGANFRGDWSALTGALAKPASVRHNGFYWALLNNLANVTTSQPGVSADWTKFPFGQKPTQAVAVNTLMVSGVHYLITAPGVQLSLPVTPLQGDEFEATNISGQSGPKIVMGAHKLRTATVGEIVFVSEQPHGLLRYESVPVGFI